MKNLYSEVPQSLTEELVEILAVAEGVRIERIVSTGHVSPQGFEYDQAEHEWVVVLQGSARLVFGDGELVEMHSGDHLLIPAHQKHRVEWTSTDEPTIWLAVFFK